MLKQVDERDYIALHVDVTKSYQDVETQINAHVATIKYKIEEFNIEDGWAKQFCSNEDSDDQRAIEIEEYFSDKEYITIFRQLTFYRLAQPLCFCIYMKIDIKIFIIELLQKCQQQGFFIMSNN